MLLSVAAFLMTSVDAGTRLARFSWQELVGNDELRVKNEECGKGASVRGFFHNMYVGTFIVCALAAGLLLGNPQAAKQLWTLFASANQLLASLTLLTATIWLVRNRKPGWITAIPMVFMFGVSSWALTAILVSAVKSGEIIRLVASGFLLALAVALVAITVVKGRKAAA